jgi:hypothetical protein
MTIPQPGDIPSGTINREYISSNFSNEKMGKNYKNIYNSLINNHD